MNYQYEKDSSNFTLENPDLTSYLYFPLANEGGVMSSITPELAGDSKLNQNTFLMSPVSSENLHNDKGSRNIWCRINQHTVWSATGKSAMQQAKKVTTKKEQTELKAGFMYHTISRISEEIGITSEITNFVPSSGEQLELMKVKITNTSREAMEIQVITAIPIYARSADNIRDHRHVTSLLNRIITTDRGVVVNPTMTFDERGHRGNKMCYGVFGGNKEESPIGYFPIVEDFIGEGGSLELPRALYEKKLQLVEKNTQLGGYESLGGLCFKAQKLEPEKSITYIIAMGYGKSQVELENCAKKFMTEEAFEQSIKETKEYWKRKVNIHYHTNTPQFDKWMRWVCFQPLLRRMYGCSFLPHHDYGKGGRGWRDLWQDCLALLMMHPEGVRGMLIDNFGGVRLDGTNATIIGNKQGEFIADRNNITRVWMDHGVWPLLTTDLYIQQTGDIQLLLEETTFFKDMQVFRGEKKDLQWNIKKGEKQRDVRGKIYHGTILEHLLIQNLTAFFDVGEHNHIRIRGADWNDALDMAEERGESVAFTTMYASNMKKIALLLEEFKKIGLKSVIIAKELEIFLNVPQKVYEQIEEKRAVLSNYCKHCESDISGEKTEILIDELQKDLYEKAIWSEEYIRRTEWVTNEQGDGWYNGYYDNEGRMVEGEIKGQTRMMLTSQVFTTMSGIATEEEIDKIIKAADTYLFNKEVGGYRLNTDFKEVKMDLGRMFGFSYGHKENGAVFSHMTIMYANALYSRGRSEAAHKVIETLFEHCNDFSKSKIYPGIPEYVDGKGRGMYHYLTGAASWLLVTVTTQMFGIRGEMGNLGFYPQLLKNQFDKNKEVTMSLIFAGKELCITYVNMAQKEVGSYEVGNIFLNDKRYKNALNTQHIERADILKLDDNMQHTIRIELI